MTGLRATGDGQHGHNGIAWENDCSIQSICEATGAEYLRAAMTMMSAGWTPGHGASWRQIRQAVTTLGFKPRFATTLGVLGAQRASETGRVFIAAGYREIEDKLKGHAWAIINGGHVDAGNYLIGCVKLTIMEIEAA